MGLLFARARGIPPRRIASAPPVPGLLDKRLLFVTGKGGVGKSTVAIAIGLAAARSGRRTMVAELAGQHRVSEALDGSVAAFTETRVADGLYTISIDPNGAMREYLHLRAGPLGDLLGSSRMFAYFAAATPGMRELLQIGKVWELAQLDRRAKRSGGYDLVVVDAPASGHGAGMLRTPRTFADLARVGPIAHQGRRIDEMIRDRRRTAIVAVALPEEMPVTETLALRAELRSELGHDLDLAIVNAVAPRRFSAQEAERVGRALEHAGGRGAREALRAALSAHARAGEQRKQVRRLARGTPTRPVLLPFVFAPELGREHLERLSRELEPAL